MGFQISPLNDIEGDHFPDFVVSAAGAKNHRGTVKIIRGKDFSILRTVSGDVDGQFFGTVMETDPLLSRIYVGSPYYVSPEEPNLKFRGRLDVYDVR